MSKKMRLGGKVFTIGRIVHYVQHSDAQQFPMILTYCDYKGHWADGVVFGYEGLPITLLRGVPFDSTKKAGTWHWPRNGEVPMEEKNNGPAPGKPLRVLTASKTK